MVRFREIASKHTVVPPPSLCEQVVLIALAKEPKQRFGSVLAFATALEQASQVKQPEPQPVVPISETTATNQSRQSTGMAISEIPSSQQAVSEVSADTPAQPQTILPLSDEEPLRQAEEERRQAEEERARQEKEQADKLEEEKRRQAEEERTRQEKEQADKLEEERVRKAKETALAQREMAPTAKQTPLPTEVAHSSKPPAFRPEAMVAAKPAKLSVSRHVVLLGLAGLVIVALASGIVWFTVHQASPTVGIHASPAGSITEFPLPKKNGYFFTTEVDSSPLGITAGPDGNLWFTEYTGNKIGRITTGK